MARSVHTDPLDIRAARRLAAPIAARGAGDRRRINRRARRAKQRGALLDRPRVRRAWPGRGPRVIWYPPGAGSLHPAGRADVRRLLQQLPPRYLYKLQAIELRPAPPRRGGTPLLGQWLPGRVILYAQPRSPWLLSGLPTAAEQRRLHAAGACVSVDRRSCLTTIAWPAHSLRDFMLYEVLLHEMAHHALQLRRVGPWVPAARRADHEAVADRLRRRAAMRHTRRLPECE